MKFLLLLKKKLKKQTVKRHLLPLIIGLCLAFFGTLLIFDTGVVGSTIHRFENVIYDNRMRFGLRNKKAGIDIDPRIVIIDIDEKSLRHEGHWPWSRKKVAQIAKNALDAGAFAVGFDIVFPELAENPATILTKTLIKTKHPNQTLIHQIKQLESHFDDDQKMREMLTGLPIVLGHILMPEKKANSGYLALPDQLIEKNKATALSLPHYHSFISNNKILQENNQAGAFIVMPDDDGVVRRIPMIIRFDDNKLYYSLSLNLFRYYVEKGKKQASIRFNKAEKVVTMEGNKLMLPAFSVAGYQDIILDEFGQILIPYYGYGGRLKQGEGDGYSYHYLSATDILHHRFDKKILQNTIVIIGTTAKGLYDLRSTPVDQAFPGVEIHANILSALMDSTLDNTRPIFPLHTQAIDTLDILLIFIVALGCAFIFPFLRPVTLIFSVFILMLSYIGLNWYLWSTYYFVFSLALPLLLIFLIGMLNMGWGYVFETRSKKVLAASFGQYVPPKLVEKMAKNPNENFGFEGESREMTVLFADIRNFTRISENLSATELKRLLNYFFTPMTEIIFNHTGTIDKYVGDMIMAFWGAPVKDEHHPQNAVLTALEMLKEVRAMEAQIQQKNWPPIQIGIGLNTGFMNVGDMGSEYRKAYTVIGDAVNLGSRLEGLTKQYGVSLIISETTYQLGAEGVICRPLGRVKVKGKKTAIAIYEPVCLEIQATPELLAEVKTLKKAFQYYHRKDWTYARGIFLQLNQQFPERILYSIYLKRIDEFESQDLPTSWDGAYSHTSK